MEHSPDETDFAIQSYPSGRWLEVVSILGLTLSALLIWIYWSDMPETIPRHYNAVGEPDGWGHKAVIITLPVISLFIYLMLSLISRLPRLWNVAYREAEGRRSEAYRILKIMLLWLKAEIVWFFLYIEWRTIEISLGEAGGLGGLYLSLFVGVVAVTVVVAMNRIYRLRRAV